MSKTAAYVRYAVVPSFPRLPLEQPGLSIANRRPFSRDFFNSIGRLLPVENRFAATASGLSRMRRINDLDVPAPTTHATTLLCSRRCRADFMVSQKLERTDQRRMIPALAAVRRAGVEQLLRRGGVSQGAADLA